ncbi:hypothetical protein CLU79DRAFT_838939 [Phycomyces nitens]|nr:hypothetical protein CLU79DRAFT_838939 [Phycomyces nitens]
MTTKLSRYNKSLYIQGEPEEEQTNISMSIPRPSKAVPKNPPTGLEPKSPWTTRILPNNRVSPEVPASSFLKIRNAPIVGGATTRVTSTTSASFSGVQKPKICTPPTYPKAPKVETLPGHRNSPVEQAANTLSLNNNVGPFINMTIGSINCNSPSKTSDPTRRSTFIRHLRQCKFDLIAVQETYTTHLLPTPSTHNSKPPHRMDLPLWPNIYVSIPYSHSHPYT